MTAALEEGEWSAARPGRTLPPAKTRYPFYWRLGGPQGRSGWAANLVPTGIRSRTIQTVVSHYTDWATRSSLFHLQYIKYVIKDVSVKYYCINYKYFSSGRQQLCSPGRHFSSYHRRFSKSLNKHHFLAPCVLHCSSATETLSQTNAVVT